MKNFHKGLLIWGLATLYYFYDNLLNVSPGVMKPELLRSFTISAADFGTLASCYLWAYGLMQIPAGLMMDKIGPRKTLTSAALFCSLGALLFAKAETLALAKVGRLGIGFGAAFAVIGCSKIATNWFEPKRFALFIGLMVSIGMLGPAFGLTTVDALLNICGDWRILMYVAATCGFSLAITMWFVIRDAPLNKDGRVKNVANVEVVSGLRQVIVSPQAWYVSIFASLMFVPTLAFGLLWGVPFLVEAHGMDRALAGRLVALIFIGWSIGGPIYGFLSDFIGRRNLPMLFANISTITISLLIIYLPEASVFKLAILMFLLGMCSSGFILAFAVIREKNPHGLAATAIGFINTLNTFGGAALQVIIGKVLDYVVVIRGGDKLDPSSFTYIDYQLALMSIPACLVVALLVLFLVEETNCTSFKRAKSPT